MPEKSTHPQFITTSLFDNLECVQRPVPAQREFEVEYFELLSTLPKLIDRAFEMTNKAKKKKRPMSINRNWFANELNGNVIDLVAQYFPNLVKDTGRGTYNLYLNYKYECYIKKLISNKLAPSYNHSKTSRRLVNQMAKKNEVALPIIYLGWTISKTNEKITGYFAVCNKGDERLWHSNLNAIEIPKIQIPTVEEETKAQEVTVTIKKGKKKAQ